jgi:hypothetical protein
VDTLSPILMLVRQNSSSFQPSAYAWLECIPLPQEQLASAKACLSQFHASLFRLISSHRHQ